MEFRILGPLEVRDGDRVLELPRPKQRALLACLLLRAGEVVSVEQLYEDLWGERVPATARASLQNFVSQVRRELGADVIEKRPPGYRLAADPDDVDLLRFERLVEGAKRREGHERAALLRDALSLWRGPPLADLMYEPFALRESERLEELATSAREDLVDAELELGNHADLVPTIEALVERNPLRERSRRQLMLALYRSGRQAEALEAYQETRRVLVEELGIEPGAGLRDLEQAILRQDPALGADAGAAAPVRDARELRKRATVLFAELAVSGLDPETRHRARSRALEEMRAATEYHGGSVGHAAGDELLSVFGIPSAHEDDAVRAGRAALQMARALAALGGVDVRAAIATGELVVPDWPDAAQASGDALTLARRLAETAAAGEILLDAETAAAHHGISAEQLEPRALRGEERPVAVARLHDVHGDSARIPSDTAMVGRARELARLREVFDAARTEERCRVAAVVGEPGLGKSRLAAEFGSAVAGEAQVLVGRCVSYGEGATYLPLREVIAQAAGDEPVAARLAGDEHGDLVAQRVGELVGPAGGTTATGEAFWAVRRFLEALAAERPLVLVFDDVHWAEPTFLDLVEYLEQWSLSAPILVLCLARPEVLDQRPAWTGYAIALEPLADEDAAQLVAQLAGEATPETRERIVELAEGNPLFAEQLAAHAAERAGTLDTVPPSLEALLSSRIDRLLPGERAVLERAAVVGREFWHGAVLHLSPALDVPSAGRHLLELVRRGLIRPGRSLFPREDGFRFHHVLIRDVAYRSVPAESRAELHERVADWLDSQAPGEDELIGYHLEQAHRCLVAAERPLDRHARRLAADAGERLAAAGIRAAKRGDVPAAANLLRRAAELLPPAEAARGDLLAELGIVLWQGGDVEGAQETLQRSLAAAEEARDRRAELRARVELAILGLHIRPEGAADELLSLASSAIPVFEQLRDERALSRTWIATAVVHGPFRCRYEACEQAALEALDAFRSSGWPPSVCLQELAAAHFYGPTPVVEGIRSCHELLAEADLGGEAGVLAFLAGLEGLRGDFDEARRLAARSRAVYEELGWTWRVTTNNAPILGAIELLAGDAAAAEAVLAESCAALEGWGDSGHLATQAALLGEALYRQGRYDEAARWADLSAEHAASDDASAQFSWRPVRAKVLARAGAAAEAESLAREAARLAGETDALVQRGDVLLDLAEVLSLAGRADEAAEQAEAARALFERKGSTVSAARAAGLAVA